jgi:hypothetical protein
MSSESKVKGTRIFIKEHNYKTLQLVILANLQQKHNQDDRLANMAAKYMLKR